MARVPSKAARAASGTQSLVIVDFVFDRGLLFIAIRNIGQEPAYAVRVAFSAPLRGLEGTKDVSAQALFHRLEFLPPGKQIVTFFDTSASFFRSDQSTQVTITVTCRTARGARRTATIHHDLEIYRDIGFVDGPRIASGSEQGATPPAELWQTR